MKLILKNEEWERQRLIISLVLYIGGCAVFLAAACGYFTAAM